MHPGHLEDVESAIGFLCNSYEMRNYILVGHSAGATLALQLLACSVFAKGIVCLEGIYDLPQLVKEYPNYRGFVEGAFGTVSAEDNEIGDEEEESYNGTQLHPWAMVSPAMSPVCRRFAFFFGADAFPGRIFLVHSEQDELLSQKQTMLMQKAFSRIYSSSARVETITGQFGGHDEVLTDERVWNIIGGLVREVLSALDTQTSSNEL